MKTKTAVKLYFIIMTCFLNVVRPVMILKTSPIQMDLYDILAANRPPLHRPQRKRK